MSDLFIQTQQRFKSTSADLYSSGLESKSFSQNMDLDSESHEDQDSDKDSESGFESESHEDEDEDQDQDSESELDEDQDQDSGSGSDEDEDEEEEEDEEFHYLDLNSGVLQYDFGLCAKTRDITKKYKIHMCGYQIVEESIHPFVQYLFQQDSNMFHFPTFYFRCMQNLQIDPEEEMTPEHIYFKNECLKFALEIFNVQDHESLEDLYKGFIYNDKKTENEYEIFVFFDFTGFLLHDSEIKRTWGIMNEIVNKTKIFESPIHPSICQIFQKNESLVYLCDDQDKQLPYPESLYLCKQLGSSTETVNYMNLYKKEEEYKNESVYFVDERMNHPILGYFYFFSLEPLSYNVPDPVYSIRRFAGFLIDPLYILKPLSKLESIAPKKTLSDVIPGVVDYFSKEEPTGESKEEPTEEPTGESKEEPTGEPTEEPTGESKEEPTEEPREEPFINQRNRCTYFQEIINNQRTAFWCLKSSTHFTEI